MTWNDGLEGVALEIAQTGNTPLRVTAGPGTGKSFAMKRRVARLLESGVEAERILAVTFTRNAAAALLSDLHQLGIDGCEEIHCGTLHSFCFRMLAKQSVFDYLGRTARPVIHFSSHGVAQFEAAPLLSDLDSFGSRRDCTKNILAFEAAWARLQTDDPGWALDLGDQAFHDELIKWLVFHRAILIGELVPEALRFIRNNPASDVLSQYDHVIVDEYQDLNKAEQVLLDYISANCQFAIVGDVDQSIYSFRHAHPDGIDEFPDTHPTTHSETLEDCRRCPTRVVAMADNVIRNNHPDSNSPRLLPHGGNPAGDVHIVQWPTLADETAGIADFVRKLISERDIPPEEILILTPRRMIGYAIRDRLQEQDVPVHSFYHEEMLEPQEAQEAFSLLNLTVNPEDRVALRWWLGLGSPTWNKGQYANLRQHCEASGDSPRVTLDKVLAGKLSLSRTNKLIERYQDLQTRVAAIQDLDVSEGINAIFPVDSEGVAALRESALLIVENAEEPTLQVLLDGLKTRITQPEMPDEGDFVRIMSLHKSKGLTSRAVIVAGCVEGLVPLVMGDGTIHEIEASLREQRRLFYVALTRCREVLMLSSFLRIERKVAHRIGARVQSGYGSMAATISSRFMSELGQSAPDSVAGERST